MAFILFVCFHAISLTQPYTEQVDSMLAVVMFQEQLG